MPRLILNGEPAELPEAATVRDVVARVTGREVTDAGTAADGGRLGVACALDEAVVPRSAWARTTVPEGARIDVATAVQGG